MDPSDPVVVEVVRSGFVESVHRGRVVVLDARGRPTTELGAVEHAFLVRSCAKPLQAVALLRSGWRPTAPQLALACASHDGTDAHLAVVGATLAAAGLTPADLGNPVALAHDPDVAAAQRRGSGPDRAHHMCSGKHAAMLATCVAAGWPVDGYLDPDHPLQVAVVATIEGLAGERARHLAVDGCGAPVVAVSLVALARAVNAIATAGPGSPEHEVAEAMRAHPDLVAGASRAATRLMRAVPGMLAKDGAEGVFVAATADGRTVAVKVDDGAARAAEVVTASVVAHLVDGEADVDLDALADLALPDVEGGGHPVGEVRSLV